jgi:hypothetical protein
MNEPLLQDIIRRGVGRGAAAAGVWCDAYRPHGAHEPLASANRYLRLPVILAPPSGFAQPAGFGASAWTGQFDAATTRPGDYLVHHAGHGLGFGESGGGVWFIAAQQALLPVLCIRATRMVSIHRAAEPSAIGVNPYGGALRGTGPTLATGWPASVLSGGGAGLDPGDLPTDAAPGAWTVLLPPIPRLVLRAGDAMTDDLHRTGIVAGAERTDLGWRLQVKQITT